MLRYILRRLLLLIPLLLAASAIIFLLLRLGAGFGWLGQSVTD